MARQGPCCVTSEGCERTKYPTPGTTSSRSHPMWLSEARGPACGSLDIAQAFVHQPHSLRQGQCRTFRNADSRCWASKPMFSEESYVLWHRSKEGTAERMLVPTISMKCNKCLCGRAAWSLIWGLLVWDLLLLLLFGRRGESSGCTMFVLFLIALLASKPPFISGFCEPMAVWGDH